MPIGRALAESAASALVLSMRDMEGKQSLSTRLQQGAAAPGPPRASAMKCPAAAQCLTRHQCTLNPGFASTMVQAVWLYIHRHCMEPTASMPFCFNDG